MKKLFIIRHAKSSWSDESLNDFDRPLNKRGRSNAPFMGTKLKEKGITPDLILSSLALRAKTTAELIAQKVDYSKEIVSTKEIYASSVNRLLNILRELDDSITTLFLIGHNPEISALAEKLTGFNENIVTCGVVEIEFHCSRWAEISAENAHFISFDYPKKYT